MKCCNSAFNAQGSRVIIVVVQVGAVQIHAAAAVQTLMKKRKLSLPPKLVEELVWVPVIFNPSYMFDALLCQNWPFLPPNHLTLRITLIYIYIYPAVGLVINFFHNHQVSFFN
jgi:hypothetical protein